MGAVDGSAVGSTLGFDDVGVRVGGAVVGVAVGVGVGAYVGGKHSTAGVNREPPLSKVKLAYASPYKRSSE